MPKCPKCGKEFEGKFCPDCGTQWAEEKTCPQCGSKLSGSVRFCNECGYAFFQEKQKKAFAIAFKEKLNQVIGWMKSHLKIVIPVACAVLLIIILSCTIPIGVAGKNNGIYYKIQSNGELDQSTFFVLNSDQWGREDGKTGVFKKNGDHIVFYYAILGEREEIANGTLKDYVLTVDGDVYVSEKHKHNYIDGVCERCGNVRQSDDLYTYSADGKYLIFGSYPQSQVVSSLSTSLTWEYAQSTMLPTSSNARGWTDYGYYISDSVQSYMWYLDVQYSGEKYRAVYFTNYRPYDTTNSSATSYTYQDDNGYYPSTVYWFKFEKIEWRILQKDHSSALLMANLILDSQEYYPSTSSRTVNGKTIYANNYAYSTIRKWLNETFYTTAFNEYERAIIQLTTVDNSLSTTGNATGPYVCENTQDRVFLLSYQDVTNSSYGFNGDRSAEDTARQLKSTEYAKSQGVYVSTINSHYGTGLWWLRSPYEENSYSSRSVYSGGYTSYVYLVSNTNEGVVPALRVSL